MAHITNYDPFIDSREIIERINELQAERRAICNGILAAQEALAQAKEEGDVDKIEDAQCELETARQTLDGWLESDEADELKALVALEEQCEDHPEWEHGCDLIRESRFREYAMDLATDIGSIGDVDRWPATCIDWDRAAAQLRDDYSEADFNGITYLYR